MKPNELQIGDWAAYEGKNGKVKELREHKLSLKTENSVMIVYYNNVEPIPLTAEILKKNGWSYNNEDAKYAAKTWVGNGLMLQENGVGYRIVVVSDYDDEDTNDTQFVITYIHQLQHALRLCNIDREIKL